MKSMAIVFVIATVLSGCSSSLIETAALPASNSPVVAYYALPRALYPLKIVRKQCELSVSLEKATYVPEPTRFAINYKPTDFSHDTLTVQTDASGLLMAVNGTSESQVGAIVGAVADLAVKAGTLATIDKSRTPNCPDSDFDISFLVDPAQDGGGLDALATRLSKLGVTLKNWQLSNSTLGTTLPVKPLPDYAHPQALNVTNGIWYHPAVSTKIDLEFKYAKATLDRQFEVVGPERTRFYFIPFQRRGVAKLDIKLEFDHGMLTKYSSDDTSQLLAAIQLPADIVKSILGLSTSSSGSAVAAPSRGSK